MRKECKTNVDVALVKYLPLIGNKTNNFFCSRKEYTMIDSQKKHLTVFPFKMNRSLILTLLISLLIQEKMTEIFNQLTLCPSASWNQSALIIIYAVTAGFSPHTIFLDTSNTMYVTAIDLNHVRIYEKGNLTVSRTISNNLNQSQGLFVSSMSDIYIDNQGQVQKWTSNGSNSTIAMTVNASCYSLFLSRNNTLYCSSPYLHQVLFKSLNTLGTFPTTSVGTGSSGTASNELSFPHGIFVTQLNDLYIADCGNHRIQWFKYGQTNGLTINITNLQCPVGIIIDNDGYLFVLDRDNGRLLRSDKKNYQCIVGCSSSGSALTQLNHPSSFTFDRKGNIFIVDQNNTQIRKFSLASNSCGKLIIIDFFGEIRLFLLGPSYNLPQFSPCAGWDPVGITFADNITIGQRTLAIFIDRNDSLYAAVRSLQRIKMWTKGSNIPRENFTISPITRSMFVTVNGEIYVENSNNHRVDMWRWNNNVPMPMMNIQSSCYGLFIDMKENLYCSMGDIYLVTRKSFMNKLNDTEIVAGNGTGDAALDRLHRPRGLFVAFYLNLYVADCGNDRIIRFQWGSLVGIVVTGNGATGTINLRCPSTIILDADGYLFIGDYDHDRIIGSGPRGFRCVVGCSSGSGSGSSQLKEPYAMSFDSHGNLFVADAGNNRIQQYRLIRNTCRKSQLKLNVFENH